MSPSYQNRHQYYYYYLLQVSFHSVATVLTPLTNKNKYTQMKQHKNTVNTSTHITKTPTHYKTHTYTHSHITKQVKTTTVQDTHQIK
jgi:hypothetical protein